jgi:hypothetical protein
MLQAHLIEVLTHAEAAEAAYQQQQATAGHSHIIASSALQLLAGVPAMVLVLLNTKQQQALLDMVTTLINRGLLPLLIPLIGTCSTRDSMTEMVAQLQLFFIVLDSDNSSSACGDLLLSALVEQALSHLQWLLLYGVDVTGHYVRLCQQLLTATSAADLRSKALAVYQESCQMQQQEAAAADAANNQSSAPAAEASAAATAAAFAEQMVDAVPEPDTPGLYETSSSSAFGFEPGMAYPGSSGSSMPAAADSYFGAGHYSLHCEQPELTAGSSSYTSGSSNAADFGSGGQYGRTKTWEQWQQQAAQHSLFGDAAADNASPAVFDSSSSNNNTAAAAYAGNVSQPDTSSSNLLLVVTGPPTCSSGQAARLSWGSQDDTGMHEQPSSSSWQLAEQAFQGPLYGLAAENCPPAASVSEYAGDAT